jgi:cytoskeleton protein RodZ
MSEHETIETTEQTAGELLARARNERNLSVIDAAGKLRIAPRQIEALEANDYARLPGHTIARGFVRNYARLLQLDPENVLAVFEKHVPKQNDARITLPDQNVQFSESGIGHHNRNVLWLTLGILLLTALGYLLWRWDVFFPPAVKTSSPAPIVTVAKVEAQPAVAPVVITPTEAGAAAVAAPSNGVALPAEMTQATIAEHVIHLAFDGPARVEVRDQTGKVIWVKNNLAGTEQDITAAPPLSFSIANPAKVKMTYNGDAFDLTPHIQGNMARFKLER